MVSTMNISKRILLVLLSLSGSLLFGCMQGAESPQGFSLPIGDKVMGEAVFEVYHCRACHTVYGDEAGYNETAEPKEISQTIVIGGQVTKIKTYADLVTSVINPSHKLSNRYSRSVTSVEGKSKMENFNDVMTVSELIDLVAYLQPKYELKPYDPTQYGFYH